MASSGSPFPTQAALARATGQSEANISRWLSGSATPTLKKLEPILMKLGVRLILPGENGASAALHFQEPQPESCVAEFPFRSVPLMGEVGSGGSGLERAEKTSQWLPAPDRNATPGELWAMRASAQDHSMLPTIRPGDVVLIDRALVQEPCEEDIYLVKQPPGEGGGYLLKRVCLKRLRKETVVILYSDNAKAGYSPIIYDLSEYPQKALADVIMGRATHIWSDIRG